MFYEPINQGKSVYPVALPFVHFSKSDPVMTQRSGTYPLSNCRKRVRVMDPTNAIIEVENYLFATSQLAQTTLRSVCGQVELDELLTEREKINTQLQGILDHHTDPWGIKVTTVEVKHIDLPQEMQRAMAKQAEAERERRAKVINAEGEYQAASRLVEAAGIIHKYPEALQLRYLQTLREISSEGNSHILFPIPIDLFKTFLKKK